MSSNKQTGVTGQTIALTGATGFLGQHVLQSLLSEGYQVRALTRSTQSPQPGVTWVHGSLTDEESLQTLCTGATTLAHLAGLTKALNRDAFFDINVGGSLRLFKAAEAAGVKYVLHISSLAARRPELSHYGASKSGSELLLAARRWPFNWSILRPPAIYGPGDKEILKLLKATKVGILPAPGSSKNRFSMIHVADLATAIVALLREQYKARTLEIDDTTNGGYEYRDVAQAIGKIYGKQPRIIPVPFVILGTIGAINGLIAQVMHRPAMLTLSTARYLSHDNWTVRDSFRPRLTDWSPQFDLTSGIENTIEWYKENKLL